MSLGSGGFRTMLARLLAARPARALRGSAARVVHRVAIETPAAAVQRIADEILSLRRADPWAHFEAWQDRGLHVLPVHFYSPVPDTRALRLKRDLRATMAGIDLRGEVQFELLATAFPPFASEFPTVQPGLQFGGTDALVLYAMVRYLRPSAIVEVGGGGSTLISLKALAANGSGKVTSIDPFPSAELRAAGAAGATVIAERVQDVPLAMFDGLGPNDVLFIDSTHVARSESDVLFLYLEVLPRLRQGVYVHVHDIFLPWDYRRDWLVDRHLFWNEQYLLQAFLSMNRDYSVVLANHWLGQVHRERLQATFPDAAWWGGGSFWMRRD